MGRRKIEMKLVEKLDTRQVTFSKRRAGVFNKASEFAILSGVMVAVIIFSIGGKPFTFGSPDVNTVIDRFMSDNKEEYEKDQDLISDNDLKKLEEYYKGLRNKIDVETKREKRLNKNLTKVQPLGDLNLNELIERKQAFVMLKERVKKMKEREDELEVSEALFLLAKGPIIFPRDNRKNDNDNHDAAAPNSQQTLQFLSFVLSQRGPSSLPYTEDTKWLIRQHLLSLTQTYPSLEPKTTTFTHNDGRCINLLQADCTIPMLFHEVIVTPPHTTTSLLRDLSLSITC
ncbi:hypothetical protein ACFE04_011550 [Oxalis oulophora]